MCYSAQIQADYQKYVRAWGAHVSLDEFVALYWLPAKGSRMRTPRALDLAFLADGTEGIAPVAAAIAAADAADREALAGELAQQRERLAAAQLKLASARPTKKAQDDQRIATRRIGQIETRIADLGRRRQVAADARIYPGWVVPVLVADGGRRVVRPMRFRCRPHYVEAAFDQQRPNAYNARLDNLEGFWRGLFGHSHAVVMVDAFYEHVQRDGRDTVLEFRPQDGQPLLVACLWSHWRRGDDELLSFAMITDAPPPEVLAAGHDRCIVPIRPDDLDAWLNPDPNDLAAQYAILDRRPRPYYEHAEAET